MHVKRRKKGSQINLLPQEGFAATGVGKVLLWILSSFRIIVIITELIVMTAFLSRFILDANNSDLNEEIQQKSSLIAAQASFEKEFRETQESLQIYSEIVESEGFVSRALDALISSLPPDVFLNDLTFSNNVIEIKGVSPSEKSIQQFIVNASSKAIFKTVSITYIKADVKNPSLLEFSLNATY